MECLASAVIVVSYNTSVGPSPRTKISFFLLPIYTEELLSTPKIATFLPQSNLRYEKSERESNYTISWLTILITALSKQPFRVE